MGAPMIEQLGVAQWSSPRLVAPAQSDRGNVARVQTDPITGLAFTNLRASETVRLLISAVTPTDSHAGRVGSKWMARFCGPPLTPKSCGAPRCEKSPTALVWIEALPARLARRISANA